jgi:hypothetical protein
MFFLILNQNNLKTVKMKIKKNKNKLCLRRKKDTAVSLKSSTLIKRRRKNPSVLGPRIKRTDSIISLLVYKSTSFELYFKTSNQYLTSVRVLIFTRKKINTCDELDRDRSRPVKSLFFYCFLSSSI